MKRMAPFRMILTAATFSTAILPGAALADDDDFPRYFHRGGIERLLLPGLDGWTYRGWRGDDDDRRSVRYRSWGDDDDDRPRRRRRRGRDDDDDDDDDDD
ncbi:hypothetical protein [Paracoccus denitrificans]|jgi:hypothetical protein|nr:hypothetical protein [Paracoccus denitrificans]MBB4626118.1 hypothetical protein [Paracoccus denitrificans]MCU7426723.1 hypothetical protein [Paracoccus denitrificans]QAR28558.1 hypothetical protein EO213_19905 [Paracoccus denitrificans]UPV96701.1 hypothetical protein M0K93_19985 [Paracoccus denitrificans]WQO36227.1 hypothetical protein U0005_17275 [Paracoccus denitrificans]